MSGKPGSSNPARAGETEQHQRDAVEAELDAAAEEAHRMVVRLGALVEVARRVETGGGSGEDPQE